MAESQVVFACLNKNVILLHKEEFDALGKGKLLFNTSIGPAHEVEALAEWLDHEGGYFICDTAGALGDTEGILRIIQTLSAQEFLLEEPDRPLAF